MAFSEFDLYGTVKICSSWSHIPGPLEVKASGNTESGVAHSWAANQRPGCEESLRAPEGRAGVTDAAPRCTGRR